MITQWKVSNLKSIREETELKFGPLTIFAGPNSSGKSSFIQSILLIAQTLVHKVGSRSVVLNGALTSLGRFDELRSNGEGPDQITIKCTLEPLPGQKTPIVRRSRSAHRGTIYYRASRANPLQEISCEVLFDAGPSGSQRDELSQIQPRLFSTQLSCLYRYDDNKSQRASFSACQPSSPISKIEWSEDANEIDDQLRADLSDPIELDTKPITKFKKYDGITPEMNMNININLDEISIAELREDYRSADPIGCTFDHFLPESIACLVDKIEKDAKDITYALQYYDVRRRRSHRSDMTNMYISKEIVTVLHKILKQTIDIDIEKILINDQQKSLFDSGSEPLTVQYWYEKLWKLSPRKRVNIQKVLRDCEDLSDRIHEAIKQSTPADSRIFEIVHEQPPSLIYQATRYLDHFFTSSLKYLGPLRDVPKPLYPIARTADTYDVGLRGEHTAFILELYKNEEIQYIPSANFKSTEIDREMKETTLEDAVSDWLQYLGVASSVKSWDLGKLGHELKVGDSNSNSLHDLTHVGVGISQVLPILVMCLLAKTESTLVFEQPEVHLHPKVQSLLGDFFLSMVLCNKQCIIETHSEHFIDRLRYRIAADRPGSKLNSQTKIYFVEKTHQGSSFQEIAINEYGAIPDWPEGFFDQSLSQARNILRAAANKRKANREGDDE